MHSARPSILVLSLFLGLGACDLVKKKPADKPDETEESDEDGTSKKKKKKTATPDTPTSSASSALSPPSPSGSGFAAGLASALERAAKIPSAEEFARASEVTVKGSSALGCETKTVRTWLRISCRGKNDTKGTPVVVRVGRGAGPDVYAFAANGVTSLVFPYVEGVDLTAVFSWTDKSHRLVARWPKGAPMPTVLATFEGAASPLDGTSASAQSSAADRLCKCMNQVRPKSCSEPELGNPFCDATYGSDCNALVECSLGEPGRMPNCPAGTQRYVMNTCVPVCGAGNKCPAGLTCDTTNKLCL